MTAYVVLYCMSCMTINGFDDYNHFLIKDQEVELPVEAAGAHICKKNSLSSSHSYVVITLL